MNFFSIPFGDEQLLDKEEPEPVLRLYVSGSVVQYFEPLEGYTVEEVIHMVKNGEALTTLGFGSSDSSVLLLPNLEEIAKIVRQEAGDDLEIGWDTFSDEDDDDEY